MDKEQIIRAWKDEEYRAVLTDAERAALPPHPSGVVELPDSELDSIGGAMETNGVGSLGCCHTGFYLTISCCHRTKWLATLGCCPPEAV